MARDDPDGPQVIARVLMRERGRQEGPGRGCEDRSRGQSDGSAAGGGAGAQDCRQPWKTGRTRGQIPPPPEAPGRTQSGDTLTLAREDPPGLLTPEL